MLTVQEVLAETVGNLPGLFGRFLSGFDDDHRTATAEHLPNHVMWCLGHVSLYLSRVTEQLGGGPLPETDFVTGDGTGGGAERFDTESIAFDSQPRTDPRCYPALERGVAIFTNACQGLARALRGASDEQLQHKIEWAGQTITLYGMALRVMNHCGFHAGQIADLRRALGLGRVIR